MVDMHQSNSLQLLQKQNKSPHTKQTNKHQRKKQPIGCKIEKKPKTR